jgi:hypothetical protein
MVLKFELDTALTVKCISAAACALGFTKFSILLKNAQLAIVNALVLLAITLCSLDNNPHQQSNDVACISCKAPPRCFGHPTYHHWPTK